MQPNQKSENLDKEKGQQSEGLQQGPIPKITEQVEDNLQAKSGIQLDEKPQNGSSNHLNQTHNEKKSDIQSKVPQNQQVGADNSKTQTQFGKDDMNITISLQVCNDNQNSSQLDEFQYENEYVFENNKCESENNNTMVQYKTKTEPIENAQQNKTDKDRERRIPFQETQVNSGFKSQLNEIKNEYMSNEIECAQQSSPNQHHDTNQLVSIREISDHSNLSSPNHETLQEIQEFEQVKTQEIIARQEYEVDYNQLDESVHQNQPIKSSLIYCTSANKFEDNSFEEFLKKYHKVNLEQLISKNASFHNYIISVLSKQQLYDLHELLQKNFEARNDFEKVEKIQQLVKEALKKDNINDQDDFIQDQAGITEAQLANAFDQYEGEINYHLENMHFDFTPQDKFRAKLYQLDGSSRWQDKGTGYFSIRNEGSRTYSMQLIEENEIKQDNNSQPIDLLNNEKIEQTFCFKRQRDTIITWQDKIRERDQAVSFQNCQGAQYTWEKICLIQGIDPEKNSQESIAQEDDPFINVCIENIPKMAEELKLVSNMDIGHKHEIAEKFVENNCQNLIKLGELFIEIEQEHISEIIDRGEQLFYFFIIYKGLIALNEQKLIEIMVSQNFFLQTFGALEWDPEATPENDSLIQNYTQVYHETEEQREFMEDVQSDEQIQENKKKNKAVVQNNFPQNNLTKKLFSENVIEHTTTNEEQPDQNEMQQQIIKVGQNNSVQNEEQKQADFMDYQTLFKQGQQISPDKEIPVESNKPPLNYRDFLTNVVKFKQVIDLKSTELQMRNQTSQEIQVESPTQGTRNGFDLQNITIEDRIHINYRLQYLKDTVLARNIEDASVNTINQIIMQNNREIVEFFLEEEDISYMAGTSNQRGNSLKDKIIEKIKDNSNIKEKHIAIEFMIELCQILKSLQFSQGIGGNSASNFIYGHSGNSGTNMYDKLNQVNLIGILAQSFDILVPDENVLKAYLIRDSDLNQQEIQKLFYDLEIYDKAAIQDLIETKEDRNQHQSQERNHFDETSRLDSMKMNSMEIIISFQQSPHIPPNFIIGFVSGQDQIKQGFPFLNQLVKHMIYSHEQGLKIQIADFFKQLFESDQYFERQGYKEILYREVILRFVNFIEEFAKKGTDFNELCPDEDENSEVSINYRVMKCLEYSVYLILQVLSKVVAGHKFPFRNFMNTNQVIVKVANLVNLKSNLINIEIVKFYKAILKSKDTTYIQYIIVKNLFYPVNQIFEDSYHETSPPLIHSCVRDLYELIFSQSKNNDYQSSRKLIDYLQNTDKKSQALMKNPKYKHIFSKYENGARDPNDHFLNKNYNSENSFDGSPVSVPIISEDNEGLFCTKKAKRGSFGSEMNKNSSSPFGWDPLNEDISFGDNRLTNNENHEFLDERLPEANKGSIGGQNSKLEEDAFLQDEGRKEEAHQNDDEDQNNGNLSPIGTNHQFIDDLDEEHPVSSDEKYTKGSLKKSKSDAAENKAPQPENADSGDDQNQYENEDIETSKFNDSAYRKMQDGSFQSQERLQRQEEFQKNLFKKREAVGSSSAGKIFSMVHQTKEKAQDLRDAVENNTPLKSLSPQTEKDKSITAKAVQKAHSHCEVAVDKLSTNSQGLIPDDELAKDMGIFSFDKDTKTFTKQPTSMMKGGERPRRRGSFDELEVTTPLQGVKPQKQFNPARFLTKNHANKEAQGKTENLEGIFTKHPRKLSDGQEIIPIRVGAKRSINAQTGQIQGSESTKQEKEENEEQVKQESAQKISKTNE